MTDPPASLAAALAILQTKLPAIPKNSKAQYGNYADLADVSRVLLPIMGELGLSFSAKPTWVERDDRTKDFVLAYTLRHVSGESDSGEYALGSNVGNHQTLGGAITYGRRYCLCSITGAVAEDDDDGAAASQPQAAAKKGARGKPPERPADGLPRNRDGSTARSQVTDDELAATGQMTDAELRAHNRLERDVKGTGPQGAQRLTATPEDDEFYLTPVRTPQAAPSKAQAIVMHFDRLKFTDRDERLKATSAIIGRQVTSTNDLTAAEGIEVANLLGKCKNRDALIEHLAVKAGEDTA